MLESIVCGYENFIHNKYGYVYYYIKSDTSIIFNLYVEPEFRRKGHAKKLIYLAIKEIREMAYSGDIWIEVRSKEDSIDINNLSSFYKRMGLKIL
jgi:ribosomal protein S18 acetylase RimI-like enzyme